MCELFAMSSRHPSVVTFSLDTFARRGGATADHKDGWGVAFFEGRDVRLLREPASACSSPLVQCLKDHAFESTTVISHIRKATIGELALCNTQPFQRELAGRMHVFAHNGHLPGVAASESSFLPIGETDSERAFCELLARLKRLWSSKRVPDLETRAQVIARFAADIRPLGPANFLYSDGDALFAHGNKRTGGDGTIKPPGLYVLRRCCEVDERAAGVTVRVSGGQEVVLFASVPLTTEDWVPLERGELLVARGGEVVLRLSAD